MDPVDVMEAELDDLRTSRKVYQDMRAALLLRAGKDLSKKQVLASLPGIEKKIDEISDRIQKAAESLSRIRLAAMKEQRQDSSEELVSEWLEALQEAEEGAEEDEG